jgi:hypothetical protein
MISAGVGGAVCGWANVEYNSNFHANSTDSYGRCLYSPGNGVYGDGTYQNTLAPKCTNGVCSLTVYTGDSQSLIPGSATYYGFFQAQGSSTWLETSVTVSVSSQVSASIGVSPGTQVPVGTQISSSSELTISAGYPNGFPPLPDLTFDPFYPQCVDTYGMPAEGNTDCYITEYTPNSTAYPCVPAGVDYQSVVRLACPADLSSVTSQCFYSTAAGNEKVNILYGFDNGPYGFSVSTPPSMVNIAEPNAMFCLYYSPDQHRYGLTAWDGTTIANPNLQPPGAFPLVASQSVQIGGSGSINDGINLDVPSPVPPNALIQVSMIPISGCSLTGGTLTCDPQYLEFAPPGASCTNPTTLSTCPAGTLTQISKSQGTTACVLAGDVTAPSTFHQVNTTNSTNDTSYTFCAYQPKDDASAQGTMLISSSAGTGGGTGPCPNCIIGGGGSQPPVNISSATNAICSVYFIINTVLFILALTIMIIGGAVYAGANVLPGSTRGVVQGYAMGMVMGGIVGALIAVIAPWVLSVIIGSSAQQIVALACP